MTNTQSLFKSSTNNNPLAYQLAPKTLEDYVGHESILGKNTALRQLIENDTLISIILWGPPGCGKTALSRIIAEKSKAQYLSLNAVMSKVSDLREALSTARSASEYGQKTLLFIDEIHRFNKAQQDALLPDLEKGNITLIGATTENPYFSVNSSIVSRSQIVSLSSLSEDALHTILKKAVHKLDTHTLFTEEAEAYIISQSQGDARKLLNTIELCHKTKTKNPLSIDDIKQRTHSQGVSHSSDAHYDLTSALIKSVRGSDPDAALYWLARLIRGGEDPRFIARRLIILASEDIGNADPQALVLATSTLHAVQFIGFPEAQLTLSQLITYLATAPKSNASTIAISKALNLVDQGILYDVPKSLKDSHYKGAKELGHGEGYHYAHNEPDGVSPQQHLPQKHEFYTPVNRGFEKTIQTRLDYIHKKRKPL
ncbi:AAA family ATPase [Candidatus Marinamargulisbacteria bacterium SCGC AG-343-D04]|nr:AAA family ATPase [Candidatus Marinamargulisbacteria bacterium SCGC AG-343-D04]